MTFDFNKILESIKSVEELKNNLHGKTVLLRTDYNVPLKQKNKKQIIIDDSRIKASLKTINFLLREGAKIIIISHLGEPKKYEPELSLKLVANRLSKLLNKKVLFCEHLIGEKTDSFVEEFKKNKEYRILMLENLRFNEGETTNNNEFASKLASYADYFVFDAFSVAHRQHASVVGIQKFLKSYAGFLFYDELKNLSQILIANEKPFVLISGGVKISTKLPFIKNLLDKADYVIIGGAMMFNFLKAQGFEVGKSVYSQEEVELAKQILELGKEKIIIPKDVVASKETSEKSKVKIFDSKKIDSDYIGLDIGPESVKEFKKILKNSRIIVWNGPLGYYEIKKFSKSTIEIARFISKLNCKKYACGGDTLAIINSLNLNKKFTYVSTAGGAALEFLSGKELPGIKALYFN
ncbi:MAG: phosphoglycerate kinase [Candidatus Woesearchaeota archaeon]